MNRISTEVEQLFKEYESYANDGGSADGGIATVR